MKLLDLCIQAGVFQFDQKLFHQVKGLPMGSPVSVVVSEITMHQIEKDIYENLQFDLLIWKCCVDYCFAILKTSQIHYFLIYINSINTSIQLTVELEADKALPFLDIKIMKQKDGSLQFTVYKPTSNDRYLDYRSNNPTSHKLNTIMALQKRAFTICSNEELKKLELAKVEKDLRNNG